MDPRRLILILVATVVPFGLLLAMYRCGTGPRLHPGDKLESRTCRQCDLRKVRPDCAICGGDGKVDVILPGPNRPTSVTFEVFEKKVRKPEIPGFEFEWIELPGRSVFSKPKPGALESAVLVITGPGGVKIEAKTQFTGTWTELLKPGAYTLSVNMSGYKPVIRKFDVPVMAGVIWLEDVYLDDTDLSEYYVRHPKERAARENSLMEIGLAR